MFRIVLALLFLLPASAWAATGDSCWNSTQFQAIKAAQLQPLYCLLLLDEIATASGGPQTINLATLPTTPTTGQAGAGFPDVLTFEVGSDENCAAGTVTITSSQVAGGAEKNLPQVNGVTPTLDLSGVGTVAINVNLRESPMGSVVNATWSGASAGGCSFDVLMIGYKIDRGK